MSITHLKIEQSSTNENVSASIIEKLAEVARGNLDSSSTLVGILNANKAYRDSCEFLVNKFSPNLGIIVPNGNYYIRFADTAVLNVLKAAFGDNYGLTEANALSLTNFNGAFEGNTDIETFDELKKFTNITEIYNTGNSTSTNRGDFAGCTNLKSIDATNISRIRGKFTNCTKLEEVKNFSGYAIGEYTLLGYQFKDCARLHTINLSQCQYIGYQVFDGCTSLTNVGNLNNVLAIGRGAFRLCSNLVIDVNMPNYGNFPDDNNLMRTEDKTYYRKYYYALFCKTGIRSIQNLGSICTHIRDGENVNYGIANYGFASNCPNLRYVILPAQLEYIGTYAFYGDTTLEYCKVLPTVPPTLGNTDSTQNAFPFKNCTCKFYVPDSSLSDYKLAAGWSEVANKIFPLSQFTTDFPNE